MFKAKAIESATKPNHLSFLKGVTVGEQGLDVIYCNPGQKSGVVLKIQDNQEDIAKSE